MKFDLIQGVSSNGRKQSRLSSELTRKKNDRASQVQKEAVPMESVEITFDPPRDLKEILINQVRDLKILPDVAMQAIAIADDPDARIEQLVNVIAQDVKLTADLLSLSNCSLFGATKPVLSLQNAIMRLGFRHTKSMILATCITNMMRNMRWHEIRVRDLLCEHSLLTANLCARLNDLFELGLQGEEFTSGLVHDVGRTLLAVALPNEFRVFDPLNFDEPESILDREWDALGTTHAEVGAWFLQRNQLPDELIAVAQFHHSPEKANKFNRLVAVTTVADELANFCQGNRGIGKFDCADNRHLELLEQLGVDAAADKLDGKSTEIIEAAKEGVIQMLSFA